MNNFYHKDLGLPKNIKTNWGIMRLVYTPHALRAAENDRYGQITLPEIFDTSKAEVIEIEVDQDGCVAKILYRVSHCNMYDLCIALVPYTRRVKTVWLNCRYDKHHSLDESKYRRVGRK